MSSTQGATVTTLMDLEADEPFARHCREIAQRFCPYTRPSAKHGALYVTPCRLEGQTLEELHAWLFHRCALQTERLRQLRRTSPRTVAALLCDNVVIQAPPSFDGDGARLMGWPHWMLKTLYLKVGVMFGKFWKGEIDKSRAGVEIPAPPCHFISIRTSIKSHDRQFVQDIFLEELMAADDSGEDVIAPYTQGRRLEELSASQVLELYVAVKRDVSAKLEQVTAS